MSRGSLSPALTSMQRKRTRTRTRTKISRFHRPQHFLYFFPLPAGAGLVAPDLRSRSNGLDAVRGGEEVFFVAIQPLLNCPRFIVSTLFRIEVEQSVEDIDLVPHRPRPKGPAEGGSRPFRDPACRDRSGSSRTSRSSPIPTAGPGRALRRQYLGALACR
jgi:hypothetical protein